MKNVVKFCRVVVKCVKFVKYCGIVVVFCVVFCRVWEYASRIGGVFWRPELASRIDVPN